MIEATARRRFRTERLPINPCTQVAAIPPYPTTRIHPVELVVIATCAPEEE